MWQTFFNDMMIILQIDIAWCSIPHARDRPNQIFGRLREREAISRRNGFKPGVSPWQMGDDVSRVMLAQLTSNCAEGVH